MIQTVKLIDQLIEKLDKDIKECKRNTFQCLVVLSKSLKQWDELNTAVNLAYSKTDWDDPCDLIDFFVIEDKYQKLEQSFRKLFESILSELKTTIKEWKSTPVGISLSHKESIEKSIATYHGFSPYYATELGTSPLHQMEPVDNLLYFNGINNKNIEALTAQESALMVTYNIWRDIIKRTYDLFSLKPALYPSICNQMKNDFTKYMSDNTDGLLKAMLHSIQNIKEKRSDPITPEIWGKMMTFEDEAYDLAIKEKLQKNNDARFVSFPVVYREWMEENKELLALVKCIHLDEAPFDFMQIASTRSYRKVINRDNIDLLYYLVSRRTIIQAQMFPQNDDTSAVNNNSKDYVVGKSKDDNTVTVLHDYFDDKKGKELALWVECAVELCLISFRSFNALRKEFNVKGTSTAFHNYYNKERFTEKEKSPIKEKLKELTSKS